MRKSIAILAAALTLASCSLKEEFTSYTRNEDFYNNKIELQSGLNACYNMIRTMYGGNAFWMTTECTTDLMSLSVSTMYNATLNISPAQPAFASYIWRYSYQGIMRANAMIAATDKTLAADAISQEDAVELKSEAVVLRAFFYYLLTSSFGDVPFYTETVTEENRERIASLPRMSANDTRDYLIDELKEYLYPFEMGGEGGLPLKRSYDAPFENRMTAAAGLMIAAKFCLWNERWDDAIEILGLLEDIYGHYADKPERFGVDYPLTDIPFSRKFTKESIFEMQNEYSEYGVQQTSSVAVYATPSKTNKALVVEGEDGEEDAEYIVSDNYNGICIPEMGQYSRIATSARPTSYYFLTVLSYNSPDLRSGEYSNDSNVPRGGSGNLAWRWSGFASDDITRNPEDRSVRWFNGQKAISRPWLGNKFWCPGMYYTLDSNNYKLFRFADALLMLAEAHLRAGHMDKAAEYLNITRTRAGLDPLSAKSTGGDVEAMMEEIRLERARELFGEFQRKYDLVRWGIWYERTVMYNDGLYLQDYIKPCHRYLPIPQDQVTYSHGALDNNEYQEN